MLLGFDISKWQVFLTYALLKLYFSFGYIKESQGVWQDPRYLEHKNNLINELPIGAYHFLVPDSIVSSIRGFLLRQVDLPLLPVLDVEHWQLTKEMVQLAINTWVDETDVPGIVYTRKNIWDKIGVPLPPGWKLWIAEYPRNWLGQGPLTKLSSDDNIIGKVAAWLTENTLALIGGVKRTMWQFDDRAIAPSFGTDPYQSKSLDLNVLFGPLDPITKEGAVVVPPTTPEQPIMRVRLKSYKNFRDRPAGAHMGGAPGGSEWDIYEIKEAVYSGTNYTWGRMVNKLWVAIGKNGDFSFVDVLSQGAIYVVDSEIEPVQVIAWSEAQAKEKARELLEPDTEIYQVFGPFKDA